MLSYTGGGLRLYVEVPLGASMAVTPGDNQTHYLLHVMRAIAGEKLRLFNGCDGEWLAEIEAVSKRGCVLRCLTQTAPQRAVPDVWLLFAPVKKTPSDYVAQKATELGVARLQPVITRRTVVSRVNLERMRANAVEAAEQSDRLSVPDVMVPLELPRLLQDWPADRRIVFCDEAGDALPIVEALRSLDGASWAILTGPEGGFEPTERELIRGCKPVVPVTLGPRILRADTAALATLAIWQALKGDWATLVQSGTTTT